jgi:hypothetical protein
MTAARPSACRIDGVPETPAFSFQCKPVTRIRSSVIVIVGTGRLLTEAKAAPPYGEFQKMPERGLLFGVALDIARED